MKLIVNADDFGLSKGINYGIIEAYKNGIVRSTTMMANQAAFEHGVALAEDNKGLGIGVHLTLTAGAPIASGLKTLVNEDGNFFKQGIVFENSAVFDAYELEEEFTAQIEKVLKSGIKITHLDSHHHVHGVQHILPVVCKLAKKYNLPVRGLKHICGVLDEHGIATTDAFSDEFYGENVTTDGFERIIQSDVQSLEVMCHPAYVDYDLYTASGYSIKRIYELNVMTCQETKSLIERKGIILSNYGEV